MASIEESYRVLELHPQASDEELRRAHRELTKVWHPDRFDHDPQLRRRAEEKLKAINGAFETIRKHREAEGFHGTNATGDESRDESRVRWQGRAMRRNRTWAFTLAAIAVFILLRRPAPGGLVIAVILFALVAVFIARMRRPR